MYRKLDGLDKKYKPLILEWLNSLFDSQNKYTHSLQDQWIRWNIWDGDLSVGFDSRNDNQMRLLSKIHPRFLGSPQAYTLKVVNEQMFYLRLKCLLHIEYPSIVKSILISRNKERGGTGGWHSPSDDFYTYDWRVELSDGSNIFYRNQEDKMDLVVGSYTYDSIIQERAFTGFLDKITLP